MGHYQHPWRLSRSDPVSIVDGARKIAELLRSIEQELENTANDTVSIPSQIGPFFDINGSTLCLCIVAQSRMVSAQTSNDLLSGLSRRQHEILIQLTKGHSAKIIADHLGIHPRTVEAHIHRIHQKTGTHGTAQLMEIVYAQL